MRRLALVAVLTAVAVTVPAAPAPAKVATGPAGDAFYTPPKPLPGKTHGDAIWVRKDSGETTLSEAKVNQLILYRSMSLAGKPIAVSGAVHIPPGKPPKGGWPIVSWAHATSGLGDQCAPTRDPGSGLIHAYNVYIEGLLDRWLKAGYAVVRTDYEGLGTKGVHPYLVGVSEGRGVLDIVRAARQANASLGRHLVVAGHSQGGHSALFAAALAPKWTPELGLVGAAAFAPASHGDELLAAFASTKQPTPATGYLAAATRGFDAAYPKLGVAKLLSDQAVALYPKTLSLCIPEMTANNSPFAQLAPADWFRDGADLGDVTKVARVNDPTDLTIRSPLLVEQGKTDTTVFPDFTDDMVGQLRKHGTKVSYNKYENVGHADIVSNAAADDATAWIAARLK